MTEQIAIPISGISKTLVRTKLVDGDRMLVLSGDYTKSGLYGYFICWEQKVSGGYSYTDPIHFLRKVSETTYNEALALLTETAEQRQKLGL
jgi:hypothetical protein